MGSFIPYPDPNGFWTLLTCLTSKTSKNEQRNPEIHGSIGSRIWDSRLFPKLGTPDHNLFSKNKWWYCSETRNFQTETNMDYLEDHSRTCKWFVTSMYKPLFRLFGRGPTTQSSRGKQRSAVFTSTGMILQVEHLESSERKTEFVGHVLFNSNLPAKWIHKTNSCVKDFLETSQIRWEMYFRYI